MADELVEEGSGGGEARVNADGHRGSVHDEIEFLIQIGDEAELVSQLSVEQAEVETVALTTVELPRLTSGMDEATGSHPGDAEKVVQVGPVSDLDEPGRK
ncbi:hypothetical protein [Deinococcus aetherius]|uniref:hypothetical protein n=1 Tax=Deinococcus aetherius TaxID=200252 RepID=UPI002231817A|nr:hypothetical protein [Deinococcus aetherius]